MGVGVAVPMDTISLGGLRERSIRLWFVVGATGAYAGLRGKGRILATGDLGTGEITIARDGKIKR